MKMRRRLKGGIAPHGCRIFTAFLPDCRTCSSIWLRRNISGQIPLIRTVEFIQECSAWSLWQRSNKSAEATGPRDSRETRCASRVLVQRQRQVGVFAVKLRINMAAPHLRVCSKQQWEGDTIFPIQQNRMNICRLAMRPETTPAGRERVLAFAITLQI